jgi:undecaprenyl diphosphate synthase
MKEVLCHLGIIMDGNRRWAKERGLPTSAGHRQGAKKIREVVRWCAEREIRFLSVFAFSTENWQRSAGEVNYLMKLIGQFLTQNMREIHREGGRIRASGRIEGLPASLIKKIKEAEELTKDNKKITLNVLLNYGGRTEMLDVVKKIIRDGVPEEEINEEVIGKYLYTAGLPDLDLVIRTAGEQRLSNFLIWQSAYAEFYSCPKYWPDFTEDDLNLALAEFAQRKRRFGK